MAEGFVEHSDSPADLEDTADWRIAELRRVQDDLEQAFDNSPIGIAWANMAGVLVQANPMFCRMLGRSRDELVGSTVVDITLPEDVRATEQLFARAAHTAESHFPQIQKRYQHADGHEVWTEVDIVITRDKGGAPRYLVASVQDVTERRAAARALTFRRTSSKRCSRMSIPASWPATPKAA